MKPHWILGNAFQSLVERLIPQITPRFCGIHLGLDFIA